MEGLSEATSQASKTSTSYMSTEIRWGNRFRSCIETNKEGSYVVVRKRFNDTENILTPLCSAKCLQQVYNNYFFIAVILLIKLFFFLRSLKKRQNL